MKKRPSMSMSLSVVSLIFVILAIGCGLWLLVCIVLIGLGKGELSLLGALSGGAFAGLVLFGTSAFFSMKGMERAEAREIDRFERADSEDSFSIGEGILATFEEGSLRIHGETSRTIRVPYAELRVFSVCNRTAPRETGTWKVILELPARYLAKGGKKGPLLVETDYKPRLAACLEKRGLTLLGEKPSEERRAGFTRLAVFRIPDRSKRKRALLFAIGGGILCAAGIALLFFQPAFGSVAAVFGLYGLIHGGLSYRSAQSTFSVYREGILYREPRRVDNLFLKWEEIGKIYPVRIKEDNFLRVQCAYGAYDFPMFADAYEYIKERFPEKRGEEGEA